MADPVQPFPRQLVWLVITASVLVYGALAFVFMPDQELGIPQVVLIVLAAGGLAIAMGFLKSTPAGMPPHLRDLLIWASLESVAVVGLLAAWAAGSALMYLPYGFVALALLVAARPR